ncbi:MAG: PKD domain-containing protein [Bacteroidota bacterium]
MKTINITFRVFTTVIMIGMLAFASNHSRAVNTKTVSVKVLDSCPTASFAIANNGSSVSTPINFINQSLGADTYYWDFGDGNVSCAHSPSHTYGTAGTYTVTLRASFGECTVEFIGTEDLVVF